MNDAHDSITAVETAESTKIISTSVDGKMRVYDIRMATTTTAMFELPLTPAVSPQTVGAHSYVSPLILISSADRSAHLV